MKISDHNNRLFDEKPRDWTRPSTGSETTYFFYDRSSLDEFARLRRMLQRWINRLPSAKRASFVSRMRHKGTGSPKEEINFQGAFFELFLHEFLCGNDGAVEVEPLINGLTPDFGVAEASAEGTINYVVEATNIVDESIKMSNRNDQYALDVLNEIKSPDYFLWVETEGNWTSRPKKRHLKQPFEELIRKANYHDVRERWEMSTPPRVEMLTPYATVRHDDWTLTGHLVPVINRPNKGRFVAIGSGKTFVSDPISDIKSELYEKAGRYKGVDNLVIALRGYGSPLDERDVKEALFGRSVLEFHVSNGPNYVGSVPSPVERQQLDGFWFNNSGPQNEHVIGVMVFGDLYPQSVDRATGVFYANPYVQKLMPFWTRAIAHAEYDFNTGNVQVVEGVPPCIYVTDHEPITDVQWQW